MKKFLLLSIFALCVHVSFSQLVSADSAKYFIDKNITVVGTIVDTFESKGEKKVVLLNFGKPHPNESFTVVINQADLPNFTYNPAEFLKNKKVTVTGKVIMYKEKPEIIISSPKQIAVVGSEK